MSKKKSFIKNTLANVGFTLLSRLIGFFIIPLFVKGLGQELYGIWILSQTILGYFILLDLGISGGIVKFVSESRAINDSDEIKTIINTSIIFYSIIGLVIFIITFNFSEEILLLFNISVNNKEVAVKILKISGVLALLSWPNIALSSTMDGLLKFLPKNIFLGISSLLNSCIVLFLVYLGSDLVTIVIVSSFTNLIPWIGNYVVIKKSLESWKFSVDSISFQKIKEIFHFSFWVFVQQLIVLAIYQTDQIIIGVLLPVATITIYSVVTKLFFIVRQLNGTFLGVIWPAIFAANKINDLDFIKKMVTKGCRYISIIVVPISSLGLIISPDFIKLWMGESYSEYSIWSQLLFFIWLFAPLFGVLGNVMIGIGKIKLINLIGVISTSFNLLIGIVLTKHFGIGGVILGTVITYIIGMPIQFPIYLRILKINITEVLLPNLKIVFSIIFLMILGYLLLKFLNINSMSMLFVFSIVYLLINYSVMLLKFVDNEERYYLALRWRKLKLKFS